MITEVFKIEKCPCCERKYVYMVYENGKKRCNGCGAIWKRQGSNWILTKDSYREETCNLALKI